MDDDDLGEARIASLEELRTEKNLECPVCLDALGCASTSKFPVVGQHCGHAICNECISNVLERSNACPVCRGPILQNTDTAPDRRPVSTRIREALVVMVPLATRLVIRYDGIGTHLARKAVPTPLESASRGEERAPSTAGASCPRRSL